MRRVLFLAFWLLVSFLSPVSIASQSYEAPAPDITFASLTPVFAVAQAQTAQVLAEATTDTLKVQSTYTFEAEAGDGITHLARKAVAEYLDDTEKTDTLNRAEKVYVEDFLQNNVGTFWLSIGQTQSFATSAIEEAITSVKGFDTNSLSASLAQYVSRVNWEKYESLVFDRSTESQSQSSVDENQDGSSTSDQGNTDTEAAQTQNSNTNRTRTVAYIIIVVLILVIAGYLLFRGTEGDSMKPLSELLNKAKKNGGSTDNVKAANEPQTKSTSNQAPKMSVTPEKKENGSAPTPMKEGVQMHIGEEPKQDWTKSGNSEKK